MSTGAPARTSPPPLVVSLIASGAVLIASLGKAAADSPTGSLPAATGYRAMGKKELLWQQKRYEQANGERAAKRRWQRQLDRRVGKAPPPVINLYNLWTHEYVAVAANQSAPAIPESMADRFLRCHFTNEPRAMDHRLLRTVLRAARRFRADRVDILSAYRSPKYNLLLRKKGHEVARTSQHTLGHAIDFRLRGVAPRRLYQWVKRQRVGGVGFYPESGFVHMDVGPRRTWRGH